MSDGRPPSLNSLRVFAVAGRRGSFRDAAAELGVSPSAVSHQVRALEAWVGAPLFERSVREVRLTPRGAALSAALSGAFGEIDRALEQARAGAAPSSLKIAALPLIAETWLAPRLHKFEQAHPGLSLTVDTGARVVDLAAGEADVAIRNVPGPSPGLAYRKLLDLSAAPICAPEIAARLRAPADLAETTLIGLTVGRGGWPEWLAAAGVPGLAPKRALSFDNLLSAVAATVAGRGVMLGLSPLIWEAPGAAALIAPFTQPRVDGGAYFIAHRRGDVSTLAGAFADWLQGEMRADLRRLRRSERERLARRAM